MLKYITKALENFRKLIYEESKIDRAIQCSANKATSNLSAINIKYFSKLFYQLKKINLPKSPKFPPTHWFEHVCVPPPQVTEHSPKSVHFSTTKIQNSFLLKIIKRIFFSVKNLKKPNVILANLDKLACYILEY